ncbi:pyruvate synthase subunit PorB [Palaeococcus sp. (in: euryarchaeotes)]
MAVRKPPITTREYWAPGHAACAGCGCAIVMKLATKAFSEAMEEKYGDPDAFAIAHATGCMEVVSAVFPYTAWKAPWIHVAFENAAAAASGVDAAWKKLGRKGKILVFGGDGGTADIGLQALSGMLERRHNAVYIMYDNEAYMNTGIQRSSSTPYGAWTTTSPPGTYSIGEDKPKKWVALIAAAHQVPYVATASVGNALDLVRKVKKAAAVDGPAFIQAHCTCPTGWKSPLEKGVELARLAIETGVWPLFEIENGDFHNIKIQAPGGGAKVKREGGKIVAITFKKPLEDYLRMQGRFKHLFKKPEAIQEMKEQIKAMWKVLGVEVTLP